MSDKIRVKPEELEGRILEDIQKDLAATTVEEPSVVLPQVGLDVTSRDNPDALTLEWDTDSSAPKIESSVVSDGTDRLRSSVSKPAETISSQGYNPDGVSSVGGEQPFDNGLKPGTTMPHDGLDEDGVGEGGVSPTGEDYDDSYGGNGYGRRRTQKKNPEQEEKKDPNDDPSKTPKKEGEKKDGQKGTEEGETGEGAGTPKTKAELDKEKEDALKKEKEDEAVDKAATAATVANGDPNAGGAQKQPGETTPPKKDEPERPQQDETGNGYGALNKKKNGTPNDNSDATARARRNLEHQNKVNNADSKPASSKKKPASTSSKSKSGNPIKGALAKVGNGLKNKAKGLGKKNKDSGKDSKGQDVVDKGLGALKNALLLFMKTHPVLSIGIILVLLFLIIFMIETMEDDASKGGGRGKRSCTYELSGVTSTGTVQLSNLRVELINCDGKADNYEVLTTVDFEKYILGVALAEAGPSAPDEALKAQMIAVRNFTLTRNSGMCPSHPESCFHGYNESTGIIRMRACTNDQVYWDYTKDCPKIERSGQPTLYCEGVDGSTDIWKKALSEERQKEVEALANEVMGEVLLDENGNVLKLGYQADETDKFIADANAGKSYVEILEGVYGSSNYSSAKCTYGGVYDYGDYTLSSENTSILHEPLEDFLEKNGSSLEEFNDLIASNVDDAGWGTRAGVVAAAVTLIGELGDNYGVKVPYYWGGGHYDGVVDGALGYWGSTQCHTYANNQHYNYCGFDCSGFVPWAIKNGGFKKGVDLAGNFLNMPNARKVTLNNDPQLQPGDLLESSGHIVLVVGVDEASKQYICAEAMGNAYGVLFTRRSFNESGYWGVDLEDYYNDPNYIREPIR